MFKSIQIIIDITMLLLLTMSQIYVFDTFCYFQSLFQSLSLQEIFTLLTREKSYYMLSIAFSQTLCYALVMVDPLHTVAFCLYALIDDSIITLIKCFNILSYSTCLVLLYIVSQHFYFAILINIIFLFLPYLQNQFWLTSYTNTNPINAATYQKQRQRRTSRSLTSILLFLFQCSSCLRSPKSCIYEGCRDEMIKVSN